MRIYVEFYAFVLLVLSNIAIINCKETQKVAKKTVHDPNDNRGLTPFFLQDKDGTCLGAYGMTLCDEQALWVLTKRKNKKTYSLVSLLAPSKNICLQPKGGFLGLFGSDQLALGPCSKNAAKSWDFDFISKLAVKLQLNKKSCLVRGKKKYKNSVSLQNCDKDQFLPFIYHGTAVHEYGFYLKAPDGKCFDGSKFRSCDGAGSNRLLWGIGIKYMSNEAKRYFFSFNLQEKSLCLVSAGNGNQLSKDDCKRSGSYGWGLKNGQLSFYDGKYCVARLNDNSAVLAPCDEAFEYIQMEVPSVYSSEEIATMLENPDKLTPEQKLALAEQLKRNY